MILKIAYCIYFFFFPCRCCCVWPAEEVKFDHAVHSMVFPFMAKLVKNRDGSRVCDGI